MKKTPASVDIYDFDHTVYNGDCTVDFYLYCVKSHPSLLRYFPYQAWHALKFKLGAEDRTLFKSNFFVFLHRLDDVEGLLKKFWEGHMKNIKSWYAEQDHSRDVIISASPEFLLRPAAEYLKVRALLATIMDQRTAAITGKNCRKEEKLARYKKAFGNTPVGKAYGDSKADYPIMSLAEEAFLVKGDKLQPLDLQS